MVHTDSTAARAMALRSGPGRVKHVDLKMMFIQELVKAKIVEVRKIGTLHSLGVLHFSEREVAKPRWEIVGS